MGVGGWRRSLASWSGEKAQGEATILFRSDHPLPVRSSERSALIVDDDEAAIDLMRRWLERLGYDVFAATDGETGLAMAREHRPDLILLDALLPGISGYDVLAELRGDAALSRTPVVLVTVDDDRARGLRAGASDYLRKPIREEQLRAVAKLNYAPHLEVETYTWEVMPGRQQVELADALAREMTAARAMLREVSS